MFLKSGPLEILNLVHFTIAGRGRLVLFLDNPTYGETFLSQATIEFPVNQKKTTNSITGFFKILTKHFLVARASDRRAIFSCILLYSKKAK